MAKVKAENPELSEADLMVQVSDRVKQAEAARKGRAAERLNEFPYEMLGDQLAHRPGFPRIPPLRAAVAEPPRYVDPFPDVIGGFRQLLLRDVEEREEEDRQVIRGPYPGHAPGPILFPYPRQRPIPPPFHSPRPDFVYDPNTGVFIHHWNGLIFDPWNNTLYNPRLGILQDVRSGEVIRAHPPRYRYPHQRYMHRQHPNYRY
jgi:hypothetical protein